MRPPQQSMSLAVRMAMANSAGDDEIDWSALAIKGTLETLEKSYFRLTSAPDPATVRAPSPSALPPKHAPRPLRAVIDET